MYYLRIDGINFPVAPESVTAEAANKNTPVTLVNETEINILRKPGLSSFSMDIRLPDGEYPWAFWEQDAGARVQSGYNTPETFTGILSQLKADKKVFVLMLVRDDGRNNFQAKVTLESMSVAESNEWVTATCEFKEYVDYTTKVIKKSGGGSSGSGKTSLAPKKKSYKVAKGDTLKKISKKMYGAQKYSSKIYSWNKSVIEKAAKKHNRKSSGKGKHIYKGTKLTLKKIK